MEDSTAPNHPNWRAYTCLLLQQAQNAFNDKAAQFLLIPLAALLSIRLENPATILIALPFVLFAPIAGWLADRFSKRSVLLYSAFAQSAILALLAWAFHTRQLSVALIGFTLLAIQSAFISPAKIGITKELIGSRALAFGSSIQQAATMLALLVGQIAAGWVFDAGLASQANPVEAGWKAAFYPTLILALASLPAIALAASIPATPAHPETRWSRKIPFEHFRNLRLLWSDPSLRRSSFAVFGFWSLVVYLNLWSINVARFLTLGHHGFGTTSSNFMAAASIGLIAGFGLAAFLMRRHVELGWAPWASALTGTLCFLLALIPASHPLLYLALFAVAASSSLIYAPLMAWMQDRYPSHLRGNLQSAVNLQDSLAGLLAVAAIAGIEALGTLIGTTPASILKIQAAAAGLATLGLAAYLARWLPGPTIRVFGLAIIRRLYRIRSLHAAPFPSSGGVLLLPNHLSWADAFFLTAACPRPVRFVMDEEFMKIPLVASFCRAFDTVPINRSKPRDALRISAQALKNGDVVCLFPEGQISRTGTLRELKRGFELIARQAHCPTITVWLGGAWGSIFSFERASFFRKFPHRRPHRLAIAFSAPIPAEDATPETIRDHFFDTSRIALSALCQGGNVDREALQLAQSFSLPIRQPIARFPDDPATDRFPSIARFSQQQRSPILTARPDDPLAPLHWIGGKFTRDHLPELPPTLTPRFFFDLEPDRDLSWQRPGWIYLPCFSIEATLISMSLPHPDPALASSPHQDGHRPGSLGPILPGFSLGTTTQPHPVLHHHQLLLPHSWTIDTDHFLYPPSQESGGSPTTQIDKITA